METQKYVQQVWPDSIHTMCIYKYKAICSPRHWNVPCPSLVIHSSPVRGRLSVSIGSSRVIADSTSSCRTSSEVQKGGHLSCLGSKIRLSILITFLGENRATSPRGSIMVKRLRQGYFLHFHILWLLLCSEWMSTCKYLTKGTCVQMYGISFAHTCFLHPLFLICSIFWTYVRLYVWLVRTHCAFSVLNVAMCLTNSVILFINVMKILKVCR